MTADLRDLVGTVREPSLRALLDALLGEGTRTWEAYRRAPAAKYYHQAYRHGLQHCLSVAQAVLERPVPVGLVVVPAAGARR